MSFYNILRILLMVAVSALFTNCGSSATNSDSSQLVELEMSKAEETSLVALSEEVSSIGNDSQDDGAYSEPIGDDNDDSMTDDDLVQGDDVESEDGPRHFICILEGPGKSVRLGLLDESLAENGRTPNVVCMSERACIEQVSRIFEVKGPHRRGFCPDKNPHVHSLSHDELKAMIDEVEGT